MRTTIFQFKLYHSVVPLFERDFPIFCKKYDITKCEITSKKRLFGILPDTVTLVIAYKEDYQLDAVTTALTGMTAVGI